MKNKSLLFSLFAILIGVGTLVLASGKADGLLAGDGSQSAQVQTESFDSHTFGIRVNQLTGTIDPRDVEEARIQAGKTPKAGNFTSLNWQGIGPDNVGGRTRAIMFDKRDASGVTVYAASVNGCIWKSTNLGSSWNKVNQATANLNVSCMAQTDNNDIYAGTGEYDISQGSGLYVSKDGDNFSLVPGTTPTLIDNVLHWGYINDLAAHNSRLYAGTNAGLKYKENGSEEWMTAMAIDDDGNLIPLNGFVWDVRVGTNGIIAASVDGKVYISPNGQPNAFVNQSKKQVLPDTTLFPEKLPHTGLGRIELAIAPSNPDYIYASATDQYGYFDNVYRSIDKGNSWEIIFPGKAASLPDIFVISNNPYGFTANTIAVFPNDPDRVLVGGVNLWAGHKTNEGFFYWGNAAVSNYNLDKFAPRYLHELHHTYVFRPNDPKTFMIGTDGGISINMDGELLFKTINRNYNVAQFVTLSVDGFGKPLGGTLGNGIQYVAGGNTPQTSFEVWNSDLNNSGDGAYVANSKINPDVFILSRKGGPFRRSEDQGFSFSTSYLGSGMTVPANTYCPMILWETLNDKASVDTARFKALSDIPAGQEIIVRSRIYDYPYKTAAPRDLKAGEVIYLPDPLQAKTFMALGNKVYYSKDVLDFTKTPAWWQIGAVTGNVSALGVSGDANHLYVGTETGNLYRISNLLYANTAATADISSNTCVVSVQLIRAFANRTITSVAVDQKSPKHFIVTLGNYGNSSYVYQVTNGLDSMPTFNSVQGNLPKAPVYSSLIEMNNPNLVILGTEFGVFTTQDINSGNWTRDSGPMGSIPVRVLYQQTVNNAGMVVPSGDPYIPDQYYPGFNNTGIVYAATYGRGLWASQAFVGIENPVLPETVSKGQLHIFPNPVSDRINITIELAAGTDTRIEVYDFSGRKVMEQVFPTTTGANTLQLDASLLKRGSYILKAISNQVVSTGKFIVSK